MSESKIKLTDSDDPEQMGSEELCLETAHHWFRTGLKYFSSPEKFKKCFIVGKLFLEAAEKASGELTAMALKAETELEKIIPFRDQDKYKPFKPKK